MQVQTRETPRWRRVLTGAAVFSAVLLVAAGCGSDDDSGDDSSSDTKTETSTTDEGTSSTEVDSGDEGSEAAAGTTLELGVAQGELKFDKTELTAPAGSVTFKFDNTDSIPHNIALRKGEETLGESEIVSEDSVELTIDDLEPGEYEFYCTPHLAAGMVGTLTIT